MLSAEMIMLFWFAAIALVLDVAVITGLIVEYAVRVHRERPDTAVPVARLLSRRQQGRPPLTRGSVRITRGL